MGHNKKNRNKFPRQPLPGLHLLENVVFFGSLVYVLANLEMKGK
jgi:hypothetical protein